MLPRDASLQKSNQMNKVRWNEDAHQMSTILTLFEVDTIPYGKNVSGMFQAVSYDKNVPVVIHCGYIHIGLKPNLGVGAVCTGLSGKV